MFELLRSYRELAPELESSELIENGIPGHFDAEMTYAGSWKRDIHGEARGEEFSRRAAHAILRAIESRIEQS
jgi:hypothetical protein